MPLNWLQFGLSAAGFIAVIVLAIDRWVHQQHMTGHDLRHEVRRIHERLDAHDALFEKSSERASEKGGEMIRAIGDIALDVREIQAAMKLRPWPRE